MFVKVWGWGEGDLKLGLNRCSMYFGLSFEAVKRKGKEILRGTHNFTLVDMEVFAVRYSPPS